MIAKDSIHMVNLDSSQPLKKNLQNTLMVVMYTVEGFFFFNMPPSRTFVMFNLGENSMKDLIDMVQKFVNDFNWPLILPVSFCATRTWSHWVALVAIKVPL